MRTHRGLDIGGDAATVKGLGTRVGDLHQHVAECRVAQHLAGRLCATRFVAEVGVRRRFAAQRGFRIDRSREPGRDRESAIRDAYRGQEQRVPRQAPVVAMRQRQHAQQAGRTDRPTADHGGLEGERLARRIEEQVGPCGSRRGFAAVVGIEMPAMRSVMQHEAAAADAGRLRFDEVQHQLGGNCRIHRAAAARQHLQPGVGSKRMRRHDHVPRGADEGLVSPAGCDFRHIRAGRLGRSARRQQPGTEQQARVASPHQWPPKRHTANGV